MQNCDIGMGSRSEVPYNENRLGYLQSGFYDFMITIRLSTEVKEDRRVVLILPPETPVGEADFVVTIAPRRAGARQGGSLRRHFGAVHSGDPRSGDNERIDADLARAYEGSPDEKK